jgi:hypothetical protein
MKALKIGIAGAGFAARFIWKISPNPASKWWA